MTPQERELIQALMDRLRAYGTIEKDRDAEALINTQVRQIPDSAYLLVQSVLVQEQALSSANGRVQQLEARLRELEAGRGTGVQSAGGGFLGGILGGGQAPTSVPPTRSANAPVGSPWGQTGQPPSQPQYQQPYQQPVQMAPQRSGGGFFAQALQTAAGVAGGMMAADALRGLLGGHHGGLGGMGLPGSTEQSSGSLDQSAADASQDADQDRQIALEQDGHDDNDPGTSQSSDDSSGGWGGDSSTDA